MEARANLAEEDASQAMAEKARVQQECDMLKSE